VTGSAFRFLADVTVLLHVLFVAFVIAGGLLVARWPRLAWLHLPAAAWGAWVELAGRVCPLTPRTGSAHGEALPSTQRASSSTT
jgi:hypothetical protein